MAAIFTTGSPASAGLIGDSVTVDYYFPDTSTLTYHLGTKTVAPTALFNAFDQIDFLVTNNTLQITDTFPGQVIFTAQTFNGIHLTDNSQDGIVGVTLDPASNLAGFDPSDITFDGSDIWVNIEGVIINPKTYVQLDIAVPEPFTLSLFGLGLAGLITIHRRSRVVTSVQAL